MPYLVTVYVLTGVDAAGLPVFETKHIHLEVEPGPYANELNQLQRGLEKRLPGLSFQIVSYRPDWAGNVQSFQMEVA